MRFFNKKKPSLVSKNLLKRLVKNDNNQINNISPPKKNEFLSKCKKFIISIYNNYGSIIICFIVISWFLYYRYKLNINLKKRKKKFNLYNKLSTNMETFDDRSDMVYVTPNINFSDNNNLNNNENNNNIDDQVDLLDDSDTDLFENYDDNDNNKINNEDIIDTQNKFFENFIPSNNFNQNFIPSNNFNEPLPSNSNDPTFNYI